MGPARPEDAGDDRPPRLEAARDPATELPTTFGKYFLTEKLAIGGMAEIYLAKIVGPGGFEKPLVIKKIHPKLSGQRHFVDLFVAEAKTLVTLAHGNIVPVYELGVIDDTYFIAMEYIDGPTLYRFTEVIARREARMEPAVAAWITARILEGLDYAHRKGEGVIHRDLSPRNVMLSRDGEVKLVDFGIAVTLGAVDDGSDVQSAPTGSFPYMSPEQVRREPLTGQTDLFSVGVLMWEMLVGHRLFARADPDATLAAVVDGDIPRPSHERASVPPRLDDVVMRALERDRTARWTSAGEMLHEIQRYLYSLDDTPGPRDVAALVARYCPPETRRLPTHAEADAPGTHEPAGPSTAVIPRDGAGPGGKRRARTETFATHVALKDLFERATPLFPIQAITDPEADPDLPPTNIDPPTSRPPVAERAARPTPSPRMRSIRPDSEPIGVPGRTPPSRALLVVLALGTLAIGAAAVVTFVRGRDRALQPDATIARPDALIDAIGGGLSVMDAPALDGPDRPMIDAVPTDATRMAIEPARDAGPRVRPDATADTSADAARPAGNATLKIGADPWGEIVIDGQPRGRTPAELVVSAGRHTIEVIYRGEDPPKTRRFTVDLATHETKQLQADFP